MNASAKLEAPSEIEASRMSRGPPLVSVGVPVFNGERFLERALRSLLAQTLTDFELIISDNASTDGTREICERLGEEDPRVRYIRQRKNIGAPKNWNVVVHEATGEFFKWASANDFCAPSMLARCVGELRADPGLVLCYGRTRLVDENDELLEEVQEGATYEDERPSDRFKAVCTRLGMNNAQQGVIRVEALHRTGLDRMYPGGDIALTAELALLGRFLLLPEVLMFRRWSKGTFTAMLSPLERQRIYDPGVDKPMAFLRGRLYLDYLASVHRAPMTAAEKRRAYRCVLRIARANRGNLWQECLSALRG
jgi:glycosyltransferase involved in cell wall biosynthesis